MKERKISVLHKVGILLLTTLFVVSSLTMILAEDNSKKNSFRLTDLNGIEKDKDELIKAGEEFIMEYMIYPKDIEPTGHKPEVDVTFVLDMSGSMKFLNSSLSYEMFKEKYVEFYDYEEWKEKLVDAGTHEYVEDWYDTGNVLKTEQEKRAYYDKFFADRGYLKIVIEFINESIHEDSFSMYGWKTEKELQELYNSKVTSRDGWNFSLQNETRIDAEKRAVADFIDKVDEEDTIESKFSMITYNNDSSILLNLGNADTAKDITSKMKAVNTTNGGAGLKDAYYINSKNKDDSNRFIVYVSDGANTSFIMKDNGAVGSYGSVDMSKFEYLLDESGSRLILSKYEGEVSNNIYRKSQDDSTAYTLIENLPRHYAYKVSEELIASDKSNIMRTYVVGIGDQNEPTQKEENKAIAALSNKIYTFKDGTMRTLVDKAEEAIKDVYFPLSDAAGLQEAFGKIIDDIVNTVKTTNNVVTIPFETKINFDNQNIGETPSDVVSIKSVSVGEVDGSIIKPINGDFTIENKNGAYNLVGKLADNSIVYKYDKIEKKYKANPILVKMHMSVSENYNESTIKVKDGGGLSYTIFDKDHRTEIEGVEIAILPVFVNFVDATLTIDEFANTSQLEMIPIENLDKISIVDSSGKLIGNGAEFNNKNKGEKITYDIPMNTLKGLSDKLILLKIEKTRNGIKRTYYEDVYVFLSTDVSYDLGRYGVNYNPNNRNVGLRILGPDDVENLILRDGNGASEITPEVINGAYEEKVNLSDTKYLISNGEATGKNRVGIKNENGNKNVTILKAAVLAKAKGPEVIDVKIDNSVLTGKISTESENLSKVSIVAKGEDGNVLDKKEATISGDKRGFEVRLDNFKDGVIEIDAIDINNNGSKQSPRFALKSGLYNKAAKAFMPEGTKVVYGYRYSYGVEFFYSGSGDVIFEAANRDNLSQSITMSTINGGSLFDSTKKEYKNAFTIQKSGNKLVFKKATNVPAGKYTLVFDVIFNKSTAEFIRATTTYNGSSSKDIPVDNSPTLQ